MRGIKRAIDSGLSSCQEKEVRKRKEKDPWPRFLVSFCLFLLIFSLSACRNNEKSGNKEPSYPGISQVILYGGPLREGEEYSRLEDVALYVRQYGELPPNYIKKGEAMAGRWKTFDAPGAIIGGNTFGNREGLLPKKKGRIYYEADIMAGYTNHRGPERLIYSNDGLIFYTEDHYDHFVQVIPKERSPK